MSKFKRDRLDAATIAAEADATIARLVDAIELVLRAGRGSSGRIILDGADEEFLRCVLASAAKART